MKQLNAKSQEKCIKSSIHAHRYSPGVFVDVVQHFARICRQVHVSYRHCTLLV